MLNELFKYHHANFNQVIFVNGRRISGFYMDIREKIHETYFNLDKQRSDYNTPSLGL